MRQYKESLGTYLYDLVHNSPPAGFSLALVFQKLILILLQALSLVYYILVKSKLALYKYGLLKKHKLSCPVISLGNITLGGTGKTPTAKKLAVIISNLGFKVAILNRGYRAGFKGQAGLVSDGEKIYMPAAQAGDEAYLLAKSLPGVIVVIGSNRALSGQYAIDKLKAQVIIIDDGYQHWRLERDLDIVLVDAMNPFGNKHILPRGTLREPLENLDRADAFLLTKVNYNSSSQQVKSTIKDTLRKYNQKAFIVESNHASGVFADITGWRKLPASTADESQIGTVPDLKNELVLSFSAIGNPDSFVQTLSSRGVKVVSNIAYPDHHEYSIDEMMEITRKAEEVGATVLVTTEKDAVKIPDEFINSKKMPIYVLPIEIDFYSGYDDLSEAIEKILEKNFRKA